MAKKVFDRIFSTIQIVINAIYCLLFTGVGIYKTFNCDANFEWEAFIISMIMLVLFNLGNIYIRHTIKKY